ncbi:4Fe-4S binding domain-containing protein [Dethiosulfatibacter aminovorans DSM 17477]|uniref:4Fe-4S binding domain-containing protein n=1 Tax=Dethiosulfatibacter aminovorans DSM 17477 TaxID=1121476 RepID=A0A1M6F6T5_9FIRM|nr:4Fe-4S binding protein [Dethiosulfatibacter aminovorans]SHI93381.1 4Fe-4S binding domain-containing protein [Dethiosulfatibacter aminovorans DSM 17477]
MKKKINYRLISQIFFFALVALITMNHYLAESGDGLPFIGSMSLHAICPYGGVATFVALLKYGVFVQKIHPSSLVMLGIILFAGVLFGPVVCSYACPLGSIQEWIGKIGKRVFKKHNKIIPYSIDSKLRYVRYFVLIFTVYVTTNSLKLMFLNIDPYYALFNFWSEEAVVGGIVALIATLVLSLLVERPWCKYFCPFGALMGLTNFIRIFKIRRKSETCIDCKACDRACPMNIKVSDKEVVRNHQCISCGECTSDAVCPVEDTVEMKM